MNRPVRMALCLLSVGVCEAASVQAADAGPGGQRDLASEVREVFAAKCGSCHGSHLAKPKGRFGYVLDLARVASNRGMIAPGYPAESPLWDLVRRGKMPPTGAPTGALTTPQKEVIQAWIVAGAPSRAATPPVALQPATQRPEEVAPGPLASPAGGHFVLWIGKFHLVLLHFPIALLVAAAFGECWSIARRSGEPDPAVRCSILLGAAFAVATAALGWLFAWSGYGSSMPRILTLHRWLGTAAGLWSLATAIHSERDERRGVRSPFTRVLLFAGALLVGLAGHFGGMLTHGEDFLDW
jgi:hypothetical protein